MKAKNISNSVTTAWSKTTSSLNSSTGKRLSAPSIKRLIKLPITLAAGTRAQQRRRLTPTRNTSVHNNKEENTMHIKLIRKELTYWTKVLNTAKANNRKIEVFNASSHIAYCLQILRKHNKI